MQSAHPHECRRPLADPQLAQPAGYHVDPEIGVLPQLRGRTGRDQGFAGSDRAVMNRQFAHHGDSG